MEIRIISRYTGTTVYGQVGYGYSETVTIFYS